MEEKSFQERYAADLKATRRRQHTGWVVRLALSAAAAGGMGSLFGRLSDDWRLLWPFCLILPWIVVSTVDLHRRR